MSKNSKILFVLPNFAGGGAERNLVRLANHCFSRGFEVDFCVFARNGPAEALLNKNISIHSLNSRNYYLSIFDLNRKLSEVNPSIVVGTLFHINVILCLLRGFPFTRASKFNLIIREANTLSLELSALGRLKRLFFSFAVNNLYRRASAVVAVSDGVKKDLIDNYSINPRLITVINNPVYYDPSCVATNEPYISGMKIELLMLGRLVPQKNLDAVLYACYYLQGRIDFHLSIVGSGSEINQLKALAFILGIDSNVDFISYIPDVSNYLKSSDILLLPSKWEGFPNVILDGLVFGTQIIANCKLPGAVEILGDNKYGSLVDCDDYSKICREIIFLSKNPRDPLVIQNRSRDFAPSLVFSRYETLFSSLD